MVVAVVQTNQNERTGPAVTSLSVTLTGVTAGNRIIVFVFYDCNSAPVGSCSDGTNTYAMLASTGLLSSAYAVEAFITQNVVASGGNFTITADSNSGSNYPGFIVASEVSGASEWHDGFAGTVNTTTTPTSGLGPGSTLANGMSFALCVAQTSSTNIGYDVPSPAVSLYTQQNGSITGRACAFYSRSYSAVGTQGIGFGTLASSSPCPRLLVFIPEPAPRWGFVGISAPDIVASGNAVLALPPAGSVPLPGDLFVAGVCCRGSAAFTAPSGWTIHEALNTGNTSTTLATATAGGFLASFEYDGSAGPYTFSRSGGDVALGRIAVYRAVDIGGWAYDASHATVNSVAQPQVDDPGFTTTAAGDLIVGVAAPSRSVTVLRVEGLGISNSATTSLVTQPGATAASPRWVRRADSGTTTGADCALMMAEGVQASAGATGTLTMVTSSSNSLHAYLVAGFKLTSGSTDASAAPTTGALTITGYAPTASAATDASAAPTTGALAGTGYAPTASATQEVAATPTTGMIALTGYTPAVLATQEVAANPTTGALALTGYAPAVLATQEISVAPSTGALALTGYAPVVLATQAASANPTTGVLALTGYAPTLSISITAAPNIGSIVIAGYAPSVALSVEVEVTSGLLALTGYPPDVQVTNAIGGRISLLEYPQGGLTIVERHAGTVTLDERAAFLQMIS